MLMFLLISIISSISVTIFHMFVISHLVCFHGNYDSQSYCLRSSLVYFFSIPLTLGFTQKHDRGFYFIWFIEAFIWNSLVLNILLFLSITEVNLLLTTMYLHNLRSDPKWHKFHICSNTFYIKELLLYFFFHHKPLALLSVYISGGVLTWAGSLMEENSYVQWHMWIGGFGSRRQLEIESSDFQMTTVTICVTVLWRPNFTNIVTYRGFELVNRFIGLLHTVTTNNSNSIPDLHTTNRLTLFSQSAFISRILAKAL